MKTKLFKRIGSLALAFMMTFTLSATAFAAEPEVQDTSSEVIAIAPGTNEISVLADEAAHGTAQAWDTGYAYPHLSSYIGLTQTIKITTRSPGNGGSVDLELFKGNTLKSDGNWWMGTNDTGEWTLRLPSSGDYKLVIHNHSDNVVYVTAQWL